MWPRRSRNHASSAAYDFHTLPVSGWRKPSTPTTRANPGWPWEGQPGCGRGRGVNAYGAQGGRTPMVEKAVVKMLSWKQFP